MYSTVLLNLGWGWGRVQPRVHPLLVQMFFWLNQSIEQGRTLVISHILRVYLFILAIRRNKAVCIFPTLGEDTLTSGELESISWKKSSNSNFRRTWLLRVKLWIHRFFCLVGLLLSAVLDSSHQADHWGHQWTSEWRHCLTSIIDEHETHTVLLFWIYYIYWELQLSYVFLSVKHFIDCGREAEFFRVLVSSKDTCT